MPLPTIGSSGITVSSFRASQNYPGPPPTSANANTASNSKQQQSAFSMMNMNETDVDSETRLPQGKDPSGVYSVLMTDSDMALTKRKFVKVSSIGEVEVSPDRIEFCVQITSTKTDMAAARESIRKRDEFIMLALKKLGVPPNGISTTAMVKKYKLEDEADDDDDILEAKILRDVEKQLSARKGKKGNSNTNNNIIDAGNDPILDTERIKVVKELYVVCDSLNIYMELFSIINEKLDRQVNVSPPVIRITPECLQRQSQAAARKAMDNAVLKASQILQSQKNLKATVGKLFYTIEDSLTVTDIAEYQNIHTSTTFESLKWKRNNKLVVCKLTSLFEVNTVRTRRVAII